MLSPKCIGGKALDVLAVTVEEPRQPVHLEDGEDATVEEIALLHALMRDVDLEVLQLVHKRSRSREGLQLGDMMGDTPPPDNRVHPVEVLTHEVDGREDQELGSLSVLDIPPERVHKEDVDSLASGVIRRGVIKIESYELKMVIVRVEHDDERALLVLPLQELVPVGRAQGKRSGRVEGLGVHGVRVC